MDKAEATGVTPVRDRRALPSVDRGGSRRRRYSLEEKQAILKGVAEAGATVSEASRRYGIGRSLIHNWRRQEAVATLGATVRFAPVSVAPEKPSPGGGAIEIELDGVGRHNWTFAGSDAGGRRAAAIYPLIETAKLDDIDPQTWLADMLTRLQDHPAKRIAELLPWNWKLPPQQKAAA